MDFNSLVALFTLSFAARQIIFLTTVKWGNYGKSKYLTSNGGRCGTGTSRDGQSR
jgi:hypothetical protein